MREVVALQPVSSVDLSIVVDNAIDISMPSTESVQRPPLAWDWSEREPLTAEHGYSLFLTPRQNGRRAFAAGPPARWLGARHLNLG